MVTEVELIEDHEEEPPEPLRMEHFHFPLMLWGGGLLLAAIAFLAEVILKRRENHQ